MEFSPYKKRRNENTWDVFIGGFNSKISRPSVAPKKNPSEYKTKITLKPKKLHSLDLHWNHHRKKSNSSQQQKQPKVTIQIGVSRYCIKLTSVTSYIQPMDWITKHLLKYN